MYTNAKVLKFEALSSIIDAVMISLSLKKDTFWLTHVVLISMTFFYSPFHRQCLSFVAHPHPPEQQSSSSLRCHVSNNTTNTSRYFCNNCRTFLQLVQFQKHNCFGLAWLCFKLFDHGIGFLHTRNKKFLYEISSFLFALHQKIFNSLKKLSVQDIHSLHWGIFFSISFH